MFICWQQKIELQNVSILGDVDAKIDKYEDLGNYSVFESFEDNAAQE